VLTADDLLAVVRVHADRVHDAVRRLGCGPEDAVEVVERSALDLVEAARHEDLADPVGWWFARARVLARQVAGTGDDDLPVGGGVLGGDANQARLAEALEARPERERAALLLRDSYDLPAASVGTVLNLDANSAMEVVGAARLAFLPALLGGPSLSLAGHVVDLASLARLSEGGQPAARDATTRRHAQSCERCANALDAMERARRLLSGLTVVALPDAERDGLLGRVDAQAQQALVSAIPFEEDDDEEWEDEARRPYSVSLITLGLIVAVALGIGGGLLASRARNASVEAQVKNFPLVTQAPVIVVPVITPPATLPPAVSPPPRVTYLPPSQTPVSTATATATATASSTATQNQPVVTIDPTSGPNDTQITVTGNFWTPNATITVTYVTQINGAGDTVTATSDAFGFFTTTVRAHDPQPIPGPRQVAVTDGAHNSSVTFTQT
jgi:DNA-directed RNA polymerase specialized sigma24 family protein